jgi:hypothetical protein
MDPADLHLQRALDCFLLADELPTFREREVLRELALRWLSLTERQDDWRRHATPAQRRRWASFH